jgi:hypothetical protein
MADFDKRNVADMAADNPGIDAGTTGRKRSVNWDDQDMYWRDNYGARPYTQADRRYEYYQPAYKYGHEAAFTYGGRAWDTEIDHDLERGWEQARGESNCSWGEVREAVKDAYDRTRVEARQTEV